jgi:rRNA biogenesis protein RRP5
MVTDHTLSIDSEHGRVEMTLRSGNLKRAPKGLSFSDLKQGQIFEGRVKKVEEYGLFIELDGTKLSGLCHKSEVRGFLVLIV